MAPKTVVLSQNPKRQKKRPEKRERWYNNEEEYNNRDVESNVVLRLSERFDTTAQIICEKLGYESLNEYVSNLVKINVIMQLDGAGSLDKKDIEEVEKKVLDGVAYQL